MMEYVINGLFLTQRITGIQRYALGITKELDKIVGDKHIKIIVPQSYNGGKIKLENIDVVRYGKRSGLVWEQTDFHRYLLKNKVKSINFCNVCPIGVYPGITVIHDLMFKKYLRDKSNVRIKLSHIWHTFIADYAIKHEKYIVTPSYFSRREIIKDYPIYATKIRVISNGWEHMKQILPSVDWNVRFPMLKSGNYYFSISTRSKQKNGKWVIEVAKKNPKYTFAIAGKEYEDEGEIPANVHMLGYVKDEDICSLMMNSKAFVFPSFYEGFGIPPMEALAMGTDIIVSDIPVMHEVYGGSAYYIDPYDTDVCLEELIDGSVDSREIVLNKYSWEKSAKKMYELMYS